MALRAPEFETVIGEGRPNTADTPTKTRYAAPIHFTAMKNSREATSTAPSAVAEIAK